MTDVRDEMLPLAVEARRTVSNWAVVSEGYPLDPDLEVFSALQRYHRILLEPLTDPVAPS